MSASADLGKLKSQEFQLLQSRVDGFESAWEKSGTVDLNDFLPPENDKLRPAVLQELIKTELEIRWRRHQPIGLDYYLEKYPELGPARNLSAQLIYEEYRVRQIFGDKPDLGTYEVRFPDQFADLQHLVREQPVDRTRQLVHPMTPAPASAPTPAAPAGPAGRSSQLTLQFGEGYKLVKRIGSGSFAEVWLGKAPGDHDVAIKIIIQPMEKEEAQREQQSLNLVKRLRHPYLLQTHSSYVHEDRLYIVMELADGSLRERLKHYRAQGQAGIALPELISYFREAAEALDFLHKNPIQKVLHRDIKPENILLVQGHVKVADFGLARVLHSQRMSVSGGAGTPRYMAPEVWDNKMFKISEASDQYSLAMTYAELRMGRSPFPNQDMMGLMLAHLKDPPDLASLPEPEQQVLNKALAKNPTERYGSCREWLRALELAVAPDLHRANPELYPMTTDSSQGSRDDSDGDPFGTMATDQLTPPQGSGAPPSWRSGGGAKAASYPSTIMREPRQAPWLPLVLGFAAAVALLVFLYQVFIRPKPEAPPTLTFDVKKNAAVKAGAATYVEVGLSRERVDDDVPITVTATGQPENVNLIVEEVRGAKDHWTIKVVAAPDAPPGTNQVTIKASAGEVENQVDLQLDVLPRAYYLPPNWSRNAAARLVEYEGRLFYDRIELAAGDQRVPFIFIPSNPDKHNRPFYIMENKVSVDLYTRYVTEVPSSDPFFSWVRIWYLGAVADNHPVSFIPAEQAHRFAVWLVGDGHGFLPSRDQWDIAAGRYEKPRAEGPFQGNWPEGAAPDQDKPQIAVGRKGSMACGEAKDDYSTPFQIRDMAGNGLEWTRDAQQFGDDNSAMISIPLTQQQLELAMKRVDPVNYVVSQRGQSWDEDAPFRFADLEGPMARPKKDFFQTRSEFFSFRVVLEFTWDESNK